MRTQKYGNCIKVWASADDTYNWAHRAGNSWLCSQLSGNRFFAEFQGGDLVDFTFNGKYGRDVDGTEFNAFIEDYLGSVNPK